MEEVRVIDMAVTCDRKAAAQSFPQVSHQAELRRDSMKMVSPEGERSLGREFGTLANKFFKKRRNSVLPMPLYLYEPDRLGESQFI